MFTLEHINPKVIELSQFNKFKFSFGNNNPKICSVVPVVSWFAYLRPLSEYLWVGNVNNDEMISRTDARFITISGKDFTGTIIPATSIATFSLPSDADYIADDMDECWFSGGVPKHLTVADLIGTDWARTLVLYPNVPPYNIYAIALLKSTTILSLAYRDKIVQDFLLWLFWSEFDIKN